MARLPALVRAVGQHDARGEATIAHVARRLRDTKRITSEKRGVGAALMNTTDAITLLMGAYGDISPHNAPEAVDRLRSLQPLPSNSFDRSKRQELPTELAFLKPDLSFADALERILENAPALGAWFQRNQSAWQPRNVPGASEGEFSMSQATEKFRRAGIPSLPAIARPVRILFYSPGIAAEIHIGLPWRQLEREESPFHEYYLASSGSWSAGASDVRSGLITLEFGLATLLALNEALHS